jgi:hypothetical protein
MRVHIVITILAIVIGQRKKFATKILDSLIFTVRTNKFA